MRVSEIRVKQIRVNQGLGVHIKGNPIMFARIGFIGVFFGKNVFLDLNKHSKDNLKLHTSLPMQINHVYFQYPFNNCKQYV